MLYFSKQLLECLSLMMVVLVSPSLHHITHSHLEKKKRSAEHLCKLPVNLSRYRLHRCYNWTHNKAAGKKRYLVWQHMVQLLCPLQHSLEMTCKEQHLF